MKYILVLALVLAIFSGYAQNKGITKLEAEIERYSFKITQHNKAVLSLEDSIKDLQAQIDSLKFYSFTPTNKTFVSSMKVSAKLMDEPSVLGNAIRMLREDESLEITDYTNDYYRVKAGGNYGFVLASLVKETDELYLLQKTKMSIEEQEANESFRQEQFLIQKKREEKEKETETKSEIRKKSLIEKFGKVSAQKILDEKIWLGMTDKMAKESWGNPKDINRSIGSWGAHEQWIYYDTYLYFENGKLTSWQEN
ncbi:MAG: hypothetical protein FD181_2590 [Prolixibacteraceae bacterium]|nr:MAG: hypothetical protein FD181_2590 [Prolixibacteraceae bacterium]